MSAERPIFDCEGWRQFILRRVAEDEAMRKRAERAEAERNAVPVNAAGATLQ
jgi:hypothetical protein